MAEPHKWENSIKAEEFLTKISRTELDCERLHSRIELLKLQELDTVGHLHSLISDPSWPTFGTFGLRSLISSNLRAVPQGSSIEVDMEELINVPLPPVEFMEFGGRGNSSHDVSPVHVKTLVIDGRDLSSVVSEMKIEDFLDKEPHGDLFPFTDPNKPSKANQESGAGFYSLLHNFKELERLSTKFTCPPGNSTLPSDSSKISDGFVRSTLDSRRCAYLEFKSPLAFQKGKKFIDLWGPKGTVDERSYVRQLYSYLITERVEFAFLTNYRFWYFVRVDIDEETIFGSRAYQYDEVNPSILKITAYFLDLAVKTPSKEFSAQGRHQSSCSVRIDSSQHPTDASANFHSSESPPSRPSSIGSVSGSIVSGSQRGTQHRYNSWPCLKVGKRFEHGKIGAFRGMYQHENVAAKFGHTKNLSAFVEHEHLIYNQLSVLQGSCIPNVVFFDKKDDHSVLATQYCGETLATHFSSELASRACKTLQQIHQHGILHRDVRLENFVSSGGIVFAIDFHLSRSGTKSEMEEEMQEFMRELSSK